MAYRGWASYALGAALLGAGCAGQSLAQTGREQLVGMISAAAASNIGVISGNAYAKFTAQRLYSKDGQICVESKQQVLPPFTHYACVNPADLDGRSAHAVELGKFYHSLNIGRDELEFGASIGCQGRPCVREAVVYLNPQLPTLYRLATRFSVACFTRCEGLTDALRGLAPAGAPSALPPAAAEKIVQIADAIADETKPKWPSEPAPPFVRNGPGGGPALPFRGVAVLGDSLCSAATTVAPGTIAYQCARLADLDPSGLGNDSAGACDPSEPRRRDGSCGSARSPYNTVAPIFPGIGGAKLDLSCRTSGCIKATNFDTGSGAISSGAAAGTITVTCNIDCTRLSGLLRYALQLAAARR